ncbi:MAG: dual specificity protein kinase kns1 [Claussenomyces sp. TS43310]|nr:MAG: dual specificity protein kinase kns1 [Claussenomyces sp. TS43310]
MSTPSTATATLPPHPHYGYSHHQNYQASSSGLRTNNTALPGASRLGGTYYPGSSSSIASNSLGSANSARQTQPAAKSATRLESEHGNMPVSQSASENAPSKKRQRSREPDWHSFYKNGLPKEVIVIDDSPPPQRISDSVEAVSGPSSGILAGRPVAGTGQQPPKKRKRDDVGKAYDPVYHLRQTPSAAPTPLHESALGSTISTDRTTSAIHTTAATSLGSQYSHNGATNGFEVAEVQPGQKRKRVATRQQIANEAKRREIEVNGDAYTNYKPPPRPPIKAPDVNVKVLPDVSRLAPLPGPLLSLQQNSYTKNSKVDDDDGHYIVVPDSDLTDRCKLSQDEPSWLHADILPDQVTRLLGQGTFGKVVQARDRKRGNAVAIKIIRSVQKYRDASRIELRVLSTLKANDQENRNRCIHLRDCFDYRGHICIVMDLLGQSVFDFLKSNSFVPFPNSQIQSFARQLFTSVAFLHDINLIHTDLKPENILLCENAYQTFTYNRKIPSSSSTVNRQAGQRKVLLDTDIRLIDFGSATFQDEYHSSVVSTRHYRAPEIILGLGWSYPCDIWSIGCILVEFFTGDALFQTHDNLEHLAMMESVCDGKLDPHLIQQVNKMASRNGGNPASKYFKRLKLDYPTQDTTRASRRFVKAMKRLNEIIPSNTSFCRNFLDLLKRIFVYDPADRITAKQALQHPWFKEICTPDDGTEAVKIRMQREVDRERDRVERERERESRRNGYHH